MIRAAVFNNREIAFIASAREYGFFDGWNENMIRSAIGGGRFFGFIYESDEKPAGFLTYTVGADGVFDLEDVFVLPEFRGKGAGGALVEKFICSAAESGAEKIFLEVRKSNLVAARLYEKFGFKAFSVRKKYYADGEDAVVMLKEF